MTRSPLFYPLNRGRDADAGGVAELQTDVMRFMAILSLCLVAIFALVQSIPLAPVAQAPQPVAQPQPEPVAVAEPAQEPQQQIVVTRPEPRPLPEPRAEPKPPAPQPDPVEEGFTLRFENEVALTRLVARNEVGLYAIRSDRTYRMNINRGQMSFWPASTPNQFHEMDAATVPDAVLDAYRRGNGTAPPDLKWGVTIPAATSRQLNQHLHGSTGGALIIDADGDLRLEQ